MKKILLLSFLKLLLSIFIAYVTFYICNKVSKHNFFITFMGGGIDASILYAIGKYSHNKITNREVAKW